MSGISERNPFVGPRPIQPGETLYGRDSIGKSDDKEVVTRLKLGIS